MRSTPRIGELINNSLYSHSAYDTKNHGIAPDGFDYRTANFTYGGKNYETMFNVAKNDARNNTLYGGLTKEKNHSGGLNAAPGELVLPGQSDSYNSNIAQNTQKVNGIADIKKEITAPHAPMRENAPEPLVPRAGLENQQRVIDGDSYADSIAQNTQKVNAFNREYEPEIQDLQNVYQKYGDDFEFNLILRESPRDSEGRYIDPVTGEMTIDQIAQDSKGDLAETDQKTRKFAETVLDTDTPPKDFVKLMHAGGESLKYTPKKNSEMWNRATKSVQESPERVFNELENTRVANDETMAKGIALAKHYQAMGDDLKASELYVELAKKATEAGRTVQALNLMRRTTPEGVLMSIMREVESYNDKMKNKLNKQINITPEQRAEFLGKLREAYAMPEGDLKEIRARRIAIGEAIREVRDQIPSSKWDKFTTLWKAGLLTAPTTHIRNIAGNVINGGSEKVAQTVGSAFDWMISKVTGKAYNFFTRFY